KIAAILESAGFETWCVGGAVRDALLGHAHLDWDLATAATPQQVIRVFKRTVPIGVEFGTVGVFDQSNVLHEVTTFRRDVRTDGRHAVVEFGASLDDDLARRDFTVNAIAYHPKTEELRDPFEGQVDLQRGLVRAVGDPEARMREDRLRALRAIRFAARFTFHIEPETLKAIVASAPFLGRLSPERVKQEMEKTMLQVEHASVALGWWKSTGALQTLVPAIADAPRERFEALDHLPRGGTAHKGGGTAHKGGGIAHRAASGEAAATQGGGTTKGAMLDRLAMLFFGESAGAAADATKALRFSNADSAWIAHLAAARHELGAAIDDALKHGTPDAGSIRRWVARVGRTRTAAFVALTTALWRARLARAPDSEMMARLETFGALANTIAYRDPIELADLAVDGEDLLAAGIASGPALGHVLQRLLDEVIDDPAHNTRDRLLARARSLAATLPGAGQ
ncbi:MAG TPA: CCA tRNA nucleotidyltransferase, partial [Gemmatimonadaceae bacterium]|nr:CCA tRNA nucleotidyltransferase [Gemmatimonadaceae bacterium]